MSTKFFSSVKCKSRLTDKGVELYDPEYKYSVIPKECDELKVKIYLKSELDSCMEHAVKSINLCNVGERFGFFNETTTSYLIEKFPLEKL